jgi:hypothetical protein
MTSGAAAAAARNYSIYPDAPKEPAAQLHQKQRLRVRQQQQAATTTAAQRCWRTRSRNPRRARRCCLLGTAVGWMRGSETTALARSLLQRD